MSTIWKYTLEPGRNELSMPVGAQVLAVQMQAGYPSMWAFVEPTEDKETRVFHVYGTGHILPLDPGRYVGTFQMNYGALVWHVFEGKT